MRRALPLLLFSLLCAAPALAQEPISAPSAGFELTVDIQGWEHRTQETDGRLSVLAAGPPAMGGLVQLAIQVTDSGKSGPAAGDAALDELAAQVAQEPSIELGDRFDFELDGRTARGVEVLQSASGVRFRSARHARSASRLRGQRRSDARDQRRHTAHAPERKATSTRTMGSASSC